jgi:hypothetical protein
MTVRGDRHLDYDGLHTPWPMVQDNRLSTLTVWRNCCRERFVSTVVEGTGQPYLNIDSLKRLSGGRFGQRQFTHTIRQPPSTPTVSRIAGRVCTNCGDGTVQHSRAEVEVSVDGLHIPLRLPVTLTAVRNRSGWWLMETFVGQQQTTQLRVASMRGAAHCAML